MRRDKKAANIIGLFKVNTVTNQSPVNVGLKGFVSTHYTTHEDNVGI